MADKDYRPIIRALRAQGWGLTQNANGHFRAVPPGGDAQIVHFSTSSNDHRALRNTVRDLRANGFVWPQKGRQDEAEAEPEAVSPEAGELPDKSPCGEDQAGDLDALFACLKAAKDEHALAALDVEEAREQLEEAKRRLSEAEGTHKRTAQALQEAKRRFDAAFAVEAA